MTHSYRVHYFHIVWSTKRRTPWIDNELRESLYPYLGGIIRSHKGKLIEIGGMPNHIHMLVELSNLDMFSQFIRSLKSCSTLWIHKNFHQKREFSWQEGYGSFSVSFSVIDKVREYIRNQEVHHKKVTYDEEYKRFLKLHCINYDDRFVLG